MISITYSPYVRGGYYYGSFIMAAVVIYSYSRYFFRSHLTKGEGNNDVVLSGHHPLAREHNFSPAYALLCTIFQVRKANKKFISYACLVILCYTAGASSIIPSPSSPFPPPFPQVGVPTVEVPGVLSTRVKVICC